MVKNFIVLCCVFCAALISHAQDQVELSLHLKNGDILTGVSTLEDIEFTTDYGVLNFPIDKINSIKVGLNDTRFDKGNLLKLLDNVEYGSADQKEKAFDEIIKMDEGAIPFIKAFMEASTGGPSYTSTDINSSTLYEVMLAKYNVARNYSLNDILTYNNTLKVEGSFSFEELAITTSYGKIVIARNDIDLIGVKITNQGFESKSSYKVFANEHISGNKDAGWLNTQILVKKGDKFSIKANGEVVLASLSGDTYSPDGGVNGAVGKKSDKLDYGQLVYKIGENGTTHYAGNNFNGYAEKTGILYLAIYESIYNSANTGYYTVVVKAD